MMAVRTFSTSSRPALRAAGSDITGRAPPGCVCSCYLTVTVMQSLISSWVPSVLITRKTMSN
jgi:hypothetical protein